MWSLQCTLIELFLSVVSRNVYMVPIKQPHADLFLLILEVSFKTLHFREIMREIETEWHSALLYVFIVLDFYCPCFYLFFFSLRICKTSEPLDTVWEWAHYQYLGGWQKMDQFLTANLYFFLYLDFSKEVAISQS